MVEVNPLVVYWGIVDYPEIFENLRKIPYKQYHVKNFRYPYPQRIVQSIFKAKKEYTHLVLIANDMVPTLECFNMLMQDVKEHDYDVISGIVNVDMRKWKNHYNVCLKLPAIPYIKRRYKWLAESTRKLCIRNGHNIIPVKFSGFPMMWIKRSVFDKASLSWLDSRVRGNNPSIDEANGGYALDLAFCWNCHLAGIPIYADLRCKMKHYGVKPAQKWGRPNPKVIEI